MKFLPFVGILVLGYFNIAWAWIVLLVILTLIAFVAWFQTYVWKRRIRMYGYTRNPHLSDEANELYSVYPQFYEAPFAAQTFVETSNLLWFAGLVLAVWGAFYEYWIGFAFFAAGFILALITSVCFKPSSNKINSQELHDEIMDYKLKGYLIRDVLERKNNNHFDGG